MRRGIHLQLFQRGAVLKFQELDPLMSKLIGDDGKSVASSVSNQRLCHPKLDFFNLKHSPYVKKPASN